MPTASQALILMCGDGFEPKFSRRYFSASTTNSTSISPMTILKPQKQQSWSFLEMADPNYGMKIDKLKGTVSHHVTLKGYRSNIYYDTKLKKFCWQKIFNSLGDEILPNSTKVKKNEACDTQTRQVEKAKKLLPRRQDASNLSNENLLTTRSCIDGNSYSRLEDLGFRNRIPSTFRKKIILHVQAEHSTAETERTHISPAEPSDRDANSGSTTWINMPTHQDDVSVLSDDDDDDKREDEMIVSMETISLLEEIKQKVSFKNRICPAMFMRQSLPTDTSRSAVCFSLRNQNLTHIDVKRLVESKTGFKIKSIRYDPVHIRGSSGGDIDSRWVVTFATDEEGDKLVKSGMQVDDDKIAVKWYDDVVSLEYDAFLISCADERKKRNTLFQRKSNNRRRSFKHTFKKTLR